MMELLREMLSYPFIVRALTGGLLISLCASLLGVSLVLKRYSMIGDGLSHVSFGALSVAVAFGWAPLAVSIPVVAAAAVLLLRITGNGKIKSDAAIAMISAGSLAVGIIVTSLTTGMTTDVSSYMFGSILAMSREDVVLSAVLSLIVLGMFILCYNKVFAVTFDESFARATGVRVSGYNTILAVLTAVTIVLGMRMMGAMLISSLIIFPALTSMRVFKSFSRRDPFGGDRIRGLLFHRPGAFLCVFHSGGSQRGGGQHGSLWDFFRDPGCPEAVGREILRAAVDFGKKCVKVSNRQPLFYGLNRKKELKMTKIDIISGFLGAGKTTFIKKLLEEAIAGEKVVLIENEFGEIGIDGGFLQDSGIEIREMNSGCICCSLVGDFGRSLSEVLTKYEPDRVIIEPSGVGKLSDVMKAVCDVAGEIDVVLNGSVTVVDAQKCKMYMKNFGEFFN